ncbi:hypothetical protein SLEP1_g52956 [Rubroshorea leprosula]|uniref:Leucine-rich repeat-containing N-terminal plant-type domain-containing protein n=1 Tax=Rubroshorea leprosula TaxID=152421 RepID=A0AAV5M8Q6_9ROSI|nr:hypothetical protein SLEP1_g52956 [Rubroshorea leprosula]
MKILGGGSLQLLFALLILLHIQTSIGFNSTTRDDEIRCKESERKALLAFKQGLVDEYGKLSSWGSEEEKKECCKWEGVQCSNTTGHIIVLYLTKVREDDGFYLKLRGNLSPSLFELQHLTYLGLAGNDFNFSRVPKSISSLNKIQKLDLRACNLSGSLPSQLLNLTSLQYLDLGYNNFNSVKNLEWLSSLSSLKHIDLGGNELGKVNNWPQVINKLPHLTYLSLSECNLRDAIPQSIPMINTSTFLTKLDLSSNNLTASTFHWLFKISKNLVYLNLCNNQFQGLIPENLGHMTYLEELDLRDNQFEGGIPKSFGNMCKLRYLYLYFNYLDGMLPELIGNLFGCLQLSLEELILDKNKITGPLPDMIKNFSSLRWLSLSNNQLSGIVSKSIGLLSNLEHIDISSNSLNGTISESHFSTLSKLRSLILSSNPLTIKLTDDWIPPFQLDHIQLRSCNLGPKFPSWLKSQRNFSYLDISGSEISDSIPEWFWNLSSRAFHVNLSSNHLYGVLPNLSTTKFANSFGLGIDLSKNKLEGLLPVFPSNVTSINLSENRFFGSISSLCSVTGGKLEFLDVSHNELFGKLPDCMMRWTSLVILNLADNHFFGKIPSSIGSLYRLESLGLQNNNFSGGIPWSLGNCSDLQFLGLNYNSFSGKIPTWIGERLSSLIFLLLRSNNFSGDIPLKLCWLTNIMLLDLSNNNLSGNIPWCIQNLTTLAEQEISAHDHDFIASRTGAYSGYGGSYADKAFVMWKGMERDYENGNLKTLKIIDLSSNKLTGKIPVQISILLELVQLNLSRNQLTGWIPPNIGQMRKLESLDLSWNQLSGQLPWSMSQLYFLSTLNLSYNNFSGRIPSGPQLQTFDASSFVGNPALCGLPLTPTCPEDEKSESKPKNRDMDEFWKSFKPGGHLLSQLGNLTSLQLVDLRHNYFDSIKNLEWLSHLSSLKYLDMSTIDLSKVNNWQQAVKKPPHLTNLQQDLCNLLDVVPQSFARVKSFTSPAVLDLSSNNLTAFPFQWLFNFNFSHSLV